MEVVRKEGKKLMGERVEREPERSGKGWKEKKRKRGKGEECVEEITEEIT